MTAHGRYRPGARGRYSKEASGGRTPGRTPLQILSFTVIIQVAKSGTGPLHRRPFPVFSLLFDLYSTFLRYFSCPLSPRFLRFVPLLLAHSRRSVPFRGHPVSTRDPSHPSEPFGQRASHTVMMNGHIAFLYSDIYVLLGECVKCTTFWSPDLNVVQCAWWAEGKVDDPHAPKTNKQTKQPEQPAAQCHGVFEVPFPFMRACDPR